MRFKRIPAGLVIITAMIFISSCQPQMPLYYATANPADIKQDMKTGVHLKYVIIQDEFSPELKGILHELQNSNSWKIENAVKKINLLQNPAEKNFATAYSFMLDRNFEQAQVYLVAASQQIPQANILWLDCMVELKEGTNLYSDYQKLYDETTDPLQREIIKTRYRYYRHAL